MVGLGGEHRAVRRSVWHCGAKRSRRRPARPWWPLAVTAPARVAGVSPEYRHRWRRASGHYSQGKYSLTTSKAHIRAFLRGQRTRCRVRATRDFDGDRNWQASRLRALRAIRKGPWLLYNSDFW